MAPAKHAPQPTRRTPPARGADGRFLARVADTGLDLATGDLAWGTSNGFSAIVDFARGLGAETAGVVIRHPRLLRDSELEALGRDGIGNRICQFPVTAALAPGYDIKLADGVPPEYGQRVLARAWEVFERLDCARILERWATSARVYGHAIGANSWVGDKGVVDLSQPPLWGERVRWVSTWDRRDYQVHSHTPSQHETYRHAAFLTLRTGRPLLESERYMYTGETVQVLVSPRRYTRLATRTGYSVFQEIALYLTNLLAAAQGGASLMQRASAGIFEIQGWDTMLRARGKDAQAVLQAQFECLSHLNAMFLNKGTDTFSWADLSLSGIEGGIYAIAYLLSAATGIPMVVLLGASPGSFQSGESQMDLWWALLDTIRDWLLPALTYLWDLCLAEAMGSGQIFAYSVEWKPYKTPTPDQALATQKAAVELARSAMDASLLTREAAGAGLSSTGAMGFDFGAALSWKPEKVDQPADPTPDAAPLLVGTAQVAWSALEGYYGVGNVPTEVMREYIAALDPALAERAGRLVLPKPAAPPPATPALAAPGAPASNLTPAPGATAAPGQVAQPDPAADLATGADPAPGPVVPPELAGLAPTTAGEPGGWRTAEEIAAALGVAQGKVKAWGRGQLAGMRPNMGPRNKHLYYQPDIERIVKALEISRLPDADEDGTPDDEEPAGGGED